MSPSFKNIDWVRNSKNKGDYSKWQLVANHCIKKTFNSSLYRACSKSVKPIFGRRFADAYGTFNEGDALGMTGQFVNEAAIICGGKNSIDNLNTCHEYNHIKNE